MTSMYERMRQEIVVGGGVEEETNKPSTSRAVLSAVVIGALLVWLGLKNVWTLVFVIGLLASIFLHEVGHFVTARRTGMKATQFFMGFGPRLWSRHKGEVEYGFRAIPLGAFVRIIGMNGLDEVEPEDEQRAYRNKSFPRQLLVITAGSLMHLVIALALFIGVYAFAGRYDNTGTVAVVRAPEAGSPAALAGIREGDIVVALGADKVTTRTELVDAIVEQAPGSAVEVVIQRDGVEEILTTTLASNPMDANIAYLGIATSSTGYVKQSLVNSFWYGAGDVVRTAGNSVKGVVSALNPMNSVRALQDSGENLATRPTTVVGASQIGGKLGEDEGLKAVLLLLASVNVFVGVFNMFPLLPFDGGHAAIAAYERVRSRRGERYRADINKMIPLTTIVMGLMGFLLFVGLYLDITQPL
ncbi:MAG: site-2 protease family protein [Actinobacteria bacterium]|nr:site-2 protease family protein [Actinomycetota bacterium]